MNEEFPRNFGKYHLLAPLAQGGMGALYLAVRNDGSAQQQCVIKTVLPHLADAEYTARFADEAKVVVRLCQGNLVPVFEAGRAEDQMFLAMEFIEGKDLRAVWNRCAQKSVAFPIEVAAYIVKELCLGLGYAHAFDNIKLVHRDVSPPNVLVSYDGDVKLTDFGLASSTLKMEKTAPGIIYGKVSYMSPEQAVGNKMDGRTDLYAAGIILWELLTGRQLYPPGNSKDRPQDLLARVKDIPVTPPSKRAARVPADLDEIVVKALASNPEQRYQTGKEMADALSIWLASAKHTDREQLGKFVTGLFDDEIETNRAERKALVDQVNDKKENSTNKTPRPGTAPIGGLEDPLDSGWGGSAGEARLASKKSATPRSTLVRAASQPAASTVPDDDEEEHDVVGTTINGRYRVEMLIGEGGMGRVYEAEHVDIGKRVAVKILHPVYCRTPEVVARFRREARAASRIGHPNIVDVTDSGTTEDGSVYFVMEHLEGVELAAVIDREGALDLERALKISTQICRALSAAHNAGIVHRDLKPENIFLIVREGSADFVKVLDFGIAKSAELEEQRKERLTHPGIAMGTPEYMAPEQAAGQTADARSDVYAVGAILYEMLTGRPPYDGDNFMEILTKKATVDPDPVRSFRAEIPEVVDALVMRALARLPADRPQSMEALDYELTKFLSGRGAAVAKVLGMTIEPSQSGSVVIGHASDSGGAKVDTGWDDLASGTAIVSNEPVDIKQSHGGLWAFILLLLIGGGGAGYYFLEVLPAQQGGQPNNAAAVQNVAGDAGLAAALLPDAGAVSVLPDKDKGKIRRRDRDKSKSKSSGSRRSRGLSLKETRSTLRKAKSATARARYSEAKKLYGKVLKGRHLRGHALTGLSNVAFQQGNNKQATNLALKAIRAGGGADARIAAGNAYNKRRMYAQAIKQFQLVLKRRKGNKAAKRGLDAARKRRGG